MCDVINKIYLNGIVPVVIINDVDNAISLAKSIRRAGFSTAEITFRTKAAQESIKRITTEVPDILVGAGTVTNVEMAKLAIESGAKYIVSPGLSEHVVKYCLESGIPIFPGVTSPTEIEAAMNLGLNVLKFFPAEQSGGIKMLSALYSPYSNIKFIPTGGINQNNFNEYLSLENVIACGGSWICPPALIDEKAFDKIENLCKQALLNMHNFSLLHIGVNSGDESEAKASANLFASMFSLPISEAAGSFFVGDMLEVMKYPFIGAHGHIAIQTNNIDRAMAYFEKSGFTFRKENIMIDKRGVIAAYFTQEIGGFAIHLRRLD